MDSERIRKDFPIFSQKSDGKPIIYFDNAASTQKPNQVIKRIRDFYQNEYANIHRGSYSLSEKATENFENVRKQIQKFIHAKHSHEIIFTRGTTESINLLAQSFGSLFIKENDEIIISALEHHSNIVPWQILCEQKGAKLKIIPVLPSGELDLDSYEKLISEKTKLISITHISNAIGTINPIKQMIHSAHQHQIPVFIDGAQSAPHLEINVQDLDCDFFAFSGHKIYGPTGIGVLYGKEKWLEQLPPYQSGGEMINTVTFEKTTYHKLPFKFEAGTPNIAGVIGFGVAIDYLNKLDRAHIKNYENELLEYATNKMSGVKNLKIIGTASKKASIISFVMDELHALDIGSFLDEDGIAVRTGHHCAMPLMDIFKVPATIRASFAFYNTFDEIDQFIHSLEKINRIFKAK